MTPAALNTGKPQPFSAGENPIANGDDTIDTVKGTDETLRPFSPFHNQNPPKERQDASACTLPVGINRYLFRCCSHLDEFLPPDGYRKTPGLLQPSLCMSDSHRL
jgi:hypothetical protein